MYIPQKTRKQSLISHVDYLKELARQNRERAKQYREEQIRREEAEEEEEGHSRKDGR